MRDSYWPVFESPLFRKSFLYNVTVWTINLSCRHVDRINYYYYFYYYLLKKSMVWLLYDEQQTYKWASDKYIFFWYGAEFFRTVICLGGEAAYIYTYYYFAWGWVVNNLFRINGLKANSWTFCISHLWMLLEIVFSFHEIYGIKTFFHRNIS